MRCSVAASGCPPKYWSRIWRNTGSPGAARANSVMDEHSFSASTSPKICSAVRPRSPAAAGLDLDDVLRGHWLGPLPLRWVYLHALREFAQHCGHADILREQILSGRSTAAGGPG